MALQIGIIGINILKTIYMNYGYNTMNLIWREQPGSYIQQKILCSIMSFFLWEFVDCFYEEI